MGDRSRLKKLLILGFVLAILLIAAFAIIHLNASAILHEGLARSLETFEFYSVSIVSETLSPLSVDLNISFVLKSLADFSITIESINIPLYINNNTIGPITSLTEDLTFVLPARRNVTFYAIRRVTKSEIIESIKNPPFLFSSNATIKGCASYLLATESHTHLHSISQTVQP